MSWFERHYEKLILLAVAVFLAAVSIYLFNQARGFEATFAGLVGDGPRSTELPELQVEVVTSAAARLEETPAWGGHEGLLFVSKPYIETGPPDSLELINPRHPDSPQIHPPVPNQWFLDHDLNILDPYILEVDNDGDGFSNLLEFQYETDPNDPNSHPPYHIKLRLVQYRENPFRVLFSSRMDDTFVLETLDVPQPSQFLRVGDKIRGTEFTITDFEENYEERPIGTGQTRRVEVSELTVEHAETGQTFSLVMQQEANFPDAEGVILLDWGNRPRLNVREESEFTLPPEPDVTYRVLELESNRAKIERLDTGDQIEVTRSR